MLQLATIGFSELVQRMAAAVRSQVNSLVDMTPGSVLRSLLEACAAGAIWMQWLAVQVMSMTRASTSTGADLDSWMADFSFSRLPALAANGDVTFSRNSTGLVATVPVGTQVRTLDGSLVFLVIEDASNGAWNQAGQYVLGTLVASMILPVVAQEPGTSGNVLAMTIGILCAPIPGIDTVSNVLPFSGGVNAESDIAFRSRFIQYINSLSLATPLAVSAAINSIQQGLRINVLENSDYFGNQIPGMFSVVVDDGTGNPSATLVSAASSAIEAVRPIGARYAVMGPIVTEINISMTMNTDNSLTKPAVVSQFEANLAAWIATLPIGGLLAISKIVAIAHSADISVISCENVTINGIGEDILAPINGVFQLTSIVVS